MSVQQPKTYTANQSDMLAALANSGIQQLAPGGRARAICDILANKVAESESRQFMNIASTLLPFAIGNDLDLIGQINGVPRLQQSSASVDVSDQNFMFYVRVGTFGTINGGNDIGIPAGVQITTPGQAGPVFLAQPVVLPAGQTKQYFSANSLYSGSASNAAAGTFSRHNFTGYADSRYGSLLVTNSGGITGGRDQEDDESYRYRIHLRLVATNPSGEDALRFQILAIPGIQDVVFDTKAGTFHCYVYAVSPVASPNLLALVQSALDQNAAFPLTGTAINPDLAGISLAATLTLSSGASQTDQQTAIAAATQAAADYVNNLGVGQQLVINDVADRILNSSTLIVDVGTPNQMLDEVYLWRSRADGSRYSRRLIANYKPALGERLVVEDRQNALSIIAA